MALSNKGQYHSDSNNPKPANSAEHKEETNSLNLHISPKDDNRRISSATNKHQMHLQQLLRWDARACQLVVQIPRSFMGLETRASVSLCVRINVAH